MDLSRDHINELIREYVSDMLEWYHRDDIPLPERRFDFHDVETASEIAGSILRGAGVQLSSDSHSYKYMCREVLTALLPAHEVMMDRAGHGGLSCAEP